MVTVTQNDTAIPGHHLSFGCTTDIPRPYKWHWLRDGVLIAGAQSACAYTTPPLQPSDFGHKYSCTVHGVGGEIETSSEVEITGPKPVVVPPKEKVPMKYVANPVEVEAKVITAVEDGGPNTAGIFHLTLEDGSKFDPDGGMTSRMTPKVGDYVVTQSDGYVYLNPKEVFERKYRQAEV